MYSNIVFVISNSDSILQKFELFLKEESKIDIVFFRSYYSAIKILNQCTYESFSQRPGLIIVDREVEDYSEPIIIKKFSNIVKMDVVLGVVRDSFDVTSYEKNNIGLYDLIDYKITYTELKFRLHGALNYWSVFKEQRFFEKIMLGIGGAAAIVDINNKVQWINSDMTMLTGYKKEEILEKKFNCLTDFDFYSKYNGCCKQENPLLVQVEKKDKKKIWVNCIFGKTVLPEGTFFSYIFNDITDSKLQQDELRLSAKVFEFSGEGIIITDVDDKILAANESFTIMTGYNSNEILGKCPRILNSDSQNEIFYEKMWSVINNDGHWTGEVSVRLKDGTILPMWMAVTAVVNSNEIVDHYITIFSDITDRLAEEKHLRYLAQHDFLTGLPNRFLLKDRFIQAAANASRNNEMIAVLFIDLNKFKEINDVEGHAIGDALLQKVSERLMSQLRSTDTVSRWGGDEFVILFTRILNKKDGLKMFEKIQNCLQRHMCVNNKEYYISASIGVSYFPDDGVDLETLLARADDEMYAEKRNQ